MFRNKNQAPTPIPTPESAQPASIEQISQLSAIVSELWERIRVVNTKSPFANMHTLFDAQTGEATLEVRDGAGYRAGLRVGHSASGVWNLTRYDVSPYQDSTMFQPYSEEIRHEYPLMMDEPGTMRHIEHRPDSPGRSRDVLIKEKPLSPLISTDCEGYIEKLTGLLASQAESFA